VLTSFVDHSCVSNASLLSLPRGANVVRAAVELNPGDEIFMQYIDVAKPVEERRKIFKSGWGFTCKCPRCFAEKNLPKNVTDLLNTLAKDTNFDGNNRGVIAEMLHKLNTASTKYSEAQFYDAVDALWYTIRPRIKEVEHALIATGLPTTQLNWFKGSVLEAYSIMRSIAISGPEDEQCLQTCLDNIKI